MTPSVTRILFDRLPGLWRLERTIPGQGRLLGHVTFTPQADGRLLVQEEGLLTLDSADAPLESLRSYIYAAQDDRLVIFYNDPERRGDILHELSFKTTEAGPSAAHTHLCGADQYELQMSFSGEDKIHMNYRITGPQKKYEMVSILTRVRP